MGLFGRWFAKRMSLEQVRQFARDERLALVESSANAAAALAACRSAALERLMADAPDGSLAGVVRDRLSELDLASLGQGSLSRLAQVVRDSLELCDRSPVAGGVRQILLSFEPVLAEFQDVIERDSGVSRLEAALLAFDGMQAKRDEREREASVLQAEIVSAKGRCDGLRVRKEELLRIPELVEMKARIAQVTLERRAVKEEIARIFDVVLPLFARSEHPLLTKYVEDPVQALSSDFSLSVIKEAQLLAHSLRKEGLQDTVALSQVAGLQQAILAPLVHRYAQARRTEERLLRELDSLRVTQEFAAVLADQKSADQAHDGLVKRRASLEIPDEVRVKDQLSAVLRAWNIALV